VDFPSAEPGLGLFLLVFKHVLVANGLKGLLLSMDESRGHFHVEMARLFEGVATTPRGRRWRRRDGHGHLHLVVGRLSTSFFKIIYYIIKKNGIIIYDIIKNGVLSLFFIVFYSNLLNFP
jgi:hypothetical protein